LIAALASLLVIDRLRGVEFYEAGNKVKHVRKGNVEYSLMAFNPQFYADNVASELERIGKVEPKRLDAPKGGPPKLRKRPLKGAQF
jgi:hypothetical protein